MLLDMSEVAGCVSAIASVVGLFFLALQIRENSEIAKSDFTFEMIEKLESFVIKNDSNPQCIHNVLKEDKENGIKDGPNFYKNVFECRSNEIYFILNYFEKLSLAYKTKAINRKTLTDLYGYRILEQYRKLKPLIDLIQSREKEETGRGLAYVPYQHFTEFSKDLEKMYQRAESSLKQKLQAAQGKFSRLK